MTSTNPAVKTKRLIITEVVISLGLFLLALLPRAYDLYRFVTADEAKWVYRSAQFLAAFLAGDLAGTSVNLTPAVTTTWLGSWGLSLYYGLNQHIIAMPFHEWLLSLPQFRTEMPPLVAARWPLVIFTSLSVVLIYHLTRHLFNRPLALLAAIFMALSPHTVSLSRILGHDAPAAMTMVISLLLLLLAVSKSQEQKSKDLLRLATLTTKAQTIKGNQADQSAALPTKSAKAAKPKITLTLLFILSGISAGLAFLSKTPTLFLIPFAGLIFLWQIWLDKKSFLHWLKLGLVWVIAAYLTFIIVWPAAWTDPLGRPWAVIENAFLSATDQEEAAGETFSTVPNLGPLYYPVYTSFKLSPLVLLGFILFLFSLPHPSPNAGVGHTPSPPLPSPKAGVGPPPSPKPLLSFIILFTLFMTLGDKRSPRYILPIFPMLAILASAGWLNLAQTVAKKWRATIPPPDLTLKMISSMLIMALSLSAILILWPYRPYYFSYYNPLLGGSYTAPHVVKIGWGEGLDHIGRFLQRELGGSRVGTAYASTVAPFFKGRLSGVTGDNLDYVVLYQKQVQSGNPSPAFIRYFEQYNPIFTVALNGITYANVYPGPSVQLIASDNDELSHSPRPLGFRPHTPYGRIGETLTVDVLWETDTPPGPISVSLSLEPLTTLETTAEQSESHPLVEATAPLKQPDTELWVSQHQLALPPDLERGQYALLAEGHPLGQLELRFFQAPEAMGAVKDTVFGQQIALTGFQLGPSEDFIAVNLSWQALQAPLPDYTVFVQLLDEKSNARLAGFDSQPVNGAWPSSRWVQDEVIMDNHLIAVPYQLPPGYYKIIVGLYQTETGQRLTLADGQDHWTIPWSLQRKEVSP